MITYSFIKSGFTIVILYYVFLFMIYVFGGPKTKQDFWLTLTPLAIIIYPIIWIIQWYKKLE